MCFEGKRLVVTASLMHLDCPCQPGVAVRIASVAKLSRSCLPDDFYQLVDFNHLTCPEE
ncbi:MAG: hypothetical protein KatS3mg022_1206 [Armatimonadota bacterium]|nr:MAG: hypothetical protein KatS3mg022_1206 [Armatimonadota bacterium]GIV20187.1 MAG: hypothetical protein KatS3mg023_1938 [Armatimonadota bacterium]